MAKNDITIVSGAGHSNVPTLRFLTEANATAINAGEPVKFKALGARYVIPLADADGVINTITPIVGVASSASTHTASADGFVDVYMALPGVVFEISAKSSTGADTQAKIDALRLDRAIIDLTSGVYTLDATGTDVITAPFTIVGGDFTRNKLHFIVRAGATMFGDQDVA